METVTSFLTRLKPGGAVTILKKACLLNNRRKPLRSIARQSTFNKYRYTKLLGVKNCGEKVLIQSNIVKKFPAGVLPRVMNPSQESFCHRGRSNHRSSPL